MTHLAVGIRTIDEGREKGERTASALVALVLGEMERQLAEIAPRRSEGLDMGEEITLSANGEDETEAMASMEEYLNSK